MNNQHPLNLPLELKPIIRWGRERLAAQGYIIERLPEIVVATPWSNVIKFSTTKGDFYLKNTPAATFLANEPQVMQLLSKEFHADVPRILDVSETLQCFIMQDAGEVLRGKLKTKFDVALLSQAITQYAAIQRATETQIERFLELGLPDWRINTLPLHYKNLISQTYVLIEAGLTEDEVASLHKLSSKFSTQCELLASYEIPQTIGYHDFHDNNVLIAPLSQKMTFVDWSEAAITHPFFSLHTCLEQAIKHYGITEEDESYLRLQKACLQSWREEIPDKALIDIFVLAKRVRIFWTILTGHQFALSVDKAAYQAYYTNRPNPLRENFRKLMEVMLSCK